MKLHPLLAGFGLVTALALVSLIGTALEFGSTIADPLEVDGFDDREPADPAPQPDWEASNWWTYEVTVGDSDPQKAAVVVHDVDQDGIHVGTNRSNGFLGLPIDGTFSHDLNPTFAGETWTMYRFPLEDGKAWDQTLLGYNVNTTVETARLDALEGEGSTAGYEIEATAYGRTVAAYTYHPEAQWFDKLVIHDPRDGEEIFRAEFLDHGASWDEAYFVADTVHEVTFEYPAQVPGEHRFQVSESYDRAQVHLNAIVQAGGIDATVENGENEVAAARVLANGYQVDTATVDDPGEHWSLSHLGSGEGKVRLEVLGVQAITPEQAPDGTDEAIPETPGLAESPPIGALVHEAG